MEEHLTIVTEMSHAQQAQWSAVLGLSRALLLDPSLKPFKDTLEPSDNSTTRSRAEIHAERGCGDGEVSLLVKPSAEGSLVRFFTPNGTLMVPQDYERLEQEIVESDYSSILINLRHQPKRHAGEDDKTHKEILILDNTVNYYHTRIKKLVNSEHPEMPLVRAIDEPDEQFLEGKVFNTIEEFTYSENPNDNLEHFVAPYEYSGELNTDITLDRLKKYLSYIAKIRPVVLEMRPVSTPEQYEEVLSA